ncbi:glycosyl transferase [Anaerolineales bacterium HSG24]|nr:glycosyl transferase [Anaerolineales bacterium HSG24]
MRYGYFDDAQREYVITQPDTPLPWINYLGSETYFGLISNTAGGYSFYRDARLRRITRYRYNNSPFDVGGRYIYLRDNNSEEFWSPSWQPTRRDLTNYTCRHGMGYTTINSTFNQIEAETRYFVPLGETLEIWSLTVTNHQANTVSLSAFSSIEFCLWDAHDDATNFQRNFNTGEMEVEGSVIYHKTEYRERRNHFAYFACSEPLAGYDTQREAFLGPYRGWDNPQAVEQGEASNSHAHGWSPIGSHQVNLTLGPGESKRVIFVLGYHENPHDQKFSPPNSQTINKSTVKPLIEKYLDPDAVDAALKSLNEHWNGLLGKFQADTPDIHTNRMINIWNAYQCMVTFNLSRSASYFESGIGRGMGFRDSNQDLLGFVHIIPGRARERILDISATQLKNGGAFHQYQPLTKRGNDAVGGNFNDDPLWLILGVTAYIKESGDWSILKEMVQYENTPGTEQPLYDHLQRSIQYTLESLGPHDLPLIGRADWNDCLNLNAFSDEPGESFQTTTNKEGKVAESIFIAGLFAYAANEMAELAEAYNRPEDAQYYKEQADKMTQTTLGDGWDGEWFLRAYDDFGDKIGSNECEEGKIFIEPQGMCIIGGMGIETGQAKKALDSVNAYLATRHGIVLQQPCYTRYYINLGEISTYPPGYKENGGIFCHNNPWIIAAETLVGNGDRAYDYYSRINPSAREEISDIHRSEPYVYAQMIAGRDAQSHGEAKNSWLTGTAAWNFAAITQWILGVRPSYNGLQVAPIVPRNWAGFQVSRVFQNVTYNIEVKRVGTGNQVSLVVDGQSVEGTIIPKPADGQTEVTVQVTLT